MQPSPPSATKKRQQQSNNFFPKTWDEKSSEVKYRPYKSPRSVRTTRKFQTDIKSKKITTRKIKETN